LNLNKSRYNRTIIAKINIKKDTLNYRNLIRLVIRNDFLMEFTVCKWAADNQCPLSLRLLFNCLFGGRRECRQ